jgi:hypothetical protein
MTSRLTINDIEIDKQKRLSFAFFFFAEGNHGFIAVVVCDIRKEKLHSHAFFQFCIVKRCDKDAYTVVFKLNYRLWSTCIICSGNIPKM